MHIVGATLIRGVLAGPDPPVEGLLIEVVPNHLLGDA